MKKMITIVIAISLLIACCPTRKIITTAEIQRDSITIKEVIRDTIVQIRQDSSAIEMLLECDSVGKVRMKELISYRSGDRTPPPKVIIRENILYAESKVDSMNVYLSMKDRYTEAVVAKKEIIVQQVNVLSWWQTLWVWIGKISAGVIFVVVAWRIFKR